MVNEPTPAPLLSIVVPVYGVEAYLYQCLESIRADIPAGESDAVELIAVDDASPDGCGDMLRSYAVSRDGVRVVHLSSNVGLGLARNAGLDVATGRYVWFVDSDDWLPPGTIAAVLDRLRQHQPDVLMLDHLRMHEDGRREVDASSRAAARDHRRDPLGRPTAAAAGTAHRLEQGGPPGLHGRAGAAVLPRLVRGHPVQPSRC